MAKEIIIDGVDVSECVKLGQYGSCRACPTYIGQYFNGYEDCDKWKNCYYKQLKQRAGMQQVKTSS